MHDRDRAHCMQVQMPTLQACVLMCLPTDILTARDRQTAWIAVAHLQSGSSHATKLGNRSEHRVEWVQIDVEDQTIVLALAAMAYSVVDLGEAVMKLRLRAF